MSSKVEPTRIRILRAALSLLEEGKKVRISDIAKAAGISRQALYLHFPGRADLLIAATRFLDEEKRVDERLAASRAATSGVARLDSFIEAWCGYIPDMIGVGRALMALRDSDNEAAAAWDDRMQALREGCEAAVAALSMDGVLVPDLEEDKATDLLWALLSVRTWEALTQDCGWGQVAYVAEIKRLAHRALVAE